MENPVGHQGPRQGIDTCQHTGKARKRQELGGTFHHAAHCGKVLYVIPVFLHLKVLCISKLMQKFEVCKNYQNNFVRWMVHFARVPVAISLLLYRVYSMAPFFPESYLNIIIYPIVKT